MWCQKDEILRKVATKFLERREEEFSRVNITVFLIHILTNYPKGTEGASRECIAWKWKYGHARRNPTFAAENRSVEEDRQSMLISSLGWVLWLSSYVDEILTTTQCSRHYHDFCLTRRLYYPRTWAKPPSLAHSQFSWFLSRSPLIPSPGLIQTSHPSLISNFHARTTSSFVFVKNKVIIQNIK